MFASRINFQFKPYVSWQPDPEALAIDAFSLDWSTMFSFCFPPFSIILKVLQKLREEEGEMCLIVPFWKTQPFFPMLGRLLIENPVILPDRKDLLSHPVKGCHHPLLEKKRLRLLACRLSGKILKNKAYLNKLQRSSLQPVDLLLSNNMTLIANSGSHFVCKGKLIPVVHMRKIFYPFSLIFFIKT